VWEDLAYDVWEVAAIEHHHLCSSGEETCHQTTDVLSEGCVELVLSALDGRLWVPPGVGLRDPWPAVAAALQRPGVSLHLALRIVGEGHGPADIVELGQRLGGFARTLCGTRVGGR
jgi:hypothetical protein